ncbi:MAG: site-specific integrase [Hydrogenovibrio crunogenus]|nr:site-specific integrase [Hydrogenovibrio crunogenus]
MSLVKQRNSKNWYCKFTAPDGKLVYRSTRTADKQLAEEYEAKLRHDLYRQIQIGDKPEMTWRNAVVKFITESESKHTKDNKSIFRILHPYFDGLYLHEINKTHIEKLIKGRKQDGVKNATINKGLEKVKALLNLAQDDWKVRVDPPKIRLLKVPRKRIRWATKNEATRLLSELLPHQYDMADFTLECGLRETNVTQLRWDQVDLVYGTVVIEGEDVLKDGVDYTVVLSDRAKEIIRRQIGKHTVNVFTYRGKPIKRVANKSWRRAVKRAGLNNFRWHDLRHTWATWHVQRGTPLPVLQELGGWADIRTVQKYAHHNVDSLRQYVGENNRGTLETVRESLEYKEKGRIAAGL